MSNFSFLKKDKDFADFADACIEAEELIGTNTVFCAVGARRALELAVRWVYQFDNDMVIPFKDDLYHLIAAPNFRKIMTPGLYPLINFIRKLGNTSIHSSKPVKRDEAVVVLRNLFEFVNWIDYTYGDFYQKRTFNEALLSSNQKIKTKENAKTVERYQEELTLNDLPLKELRLQSQEKRKEITEKRLVGQRFEEIYEVGKLSEAETRKYYIDLELKRAGWKLGENVQEERSVSHLETTKSHTGKIDYVLLGENGKPLAIIEAKKTAIDNEAGRKQAMDYAQGLEKETGVYPIIFCSNGFELTMIEKPYPARIVSSFYTQDQLELMVGRRNNKKQFHSEMINDDITNRPYQKQAIANTCSDFEDNRRKALLVMATGSGKTRTAISLIDILTKNNWVKNCLFLADRTALVNQAYSNFKKLLPSLTICKLTETTQPAILESSRMVFSTYPSIVNAINKYALKEEKPLFNTGYFDLIILDESHRSIYKKYGDLFVHFDALLIGLTATPRSDFDKNTYEFFDLIDGVPTFAYELDEAIEDGYLVPYRTIETVLKIPERGVHYDELPEEERNHFEEVFEDEAEELKDIDGSAVNNWLFNRHTIDIVLDELMNKGIRDSSGDEIGKTIIFATNHKHAEEIRSRFRLLFPSKGEEYVEVIDNYQTKSQSLIDSFSIKNKYPQIAISVDMLDTGIDVPEIVNLVFFKKVRSKVKFHQMIGRGTRLCPDLFGPYQDKSEFLIFDYGGNFDFFRLDKQVSETGNTFSITERIWRVKAEIIRELEHLNYQTEELISYRNQLVEEFHKEISTLDDHNFQVKLRLRYVHKFRNMKLWKSLTAISIEELKGNVIPLIPAEEGNELAKRFDYSILMIECGSLAEKHPTRMVDTVRETMKNLAKKGTINAVCEKEELIKKAQEKEFWLEATMAEMEEIRVELRELIQFIDKETQKNYFSNFTDEVIDVKEDDSLLLSANQLDDYRERVNHFLKEANIMAIQKLRFNRPLTTQDVAVLEKVFWEDLGSREQYEKEFGNQPLTIFIRRMVGLERQEVIFLFSEFLSNKQLNAKQIQFINKIIEYVTKNGYLEKEKFTQEPFKTVGSITELFDDSYKEIREKLLATVHQINYNAENII